MSVGFARVCLVKMRKISIIHPSRGRPHQAFLTRLNWLEKADSVFEYILSLDEDDECIEQYKYRLPKYVTLLVGRNKSAIEAINNAALVCTGDLILTISDDFNTPWHWDTFLKSELNGLSDILVKTRDGIQKTLITLPIMDRIYYKRFGYIYNPSYKHLFADTEMTVVGHYLGRIINSNLIFQHLHYSTGLSPYDDINKKNDLTNEQGEKLYNERMKINFGINNPLITYDDIVWH